MIRFNQANEYFLVISIKFKIPGSFLNNYATPNLKRNSNYLLLLRIS